MKGSGWAPKSLSLSTRTLSLYSDRKAVAPVCCHDTGAREKRGHDVTSAHRMGELLRYRRGIAGAGWPTHSRPLRMCGRRTGVGVTSDVGIMRKVSHSTKGRLVGARGVNAYRFKRKG